MKKHQPVLATCHLSVPEILILIREATKKGLVNIVVTHPEAPVVDMPTSLQCELRTAGVFVLNDAMCQLFQSPEMCPIQRIISDIREVGVKSTILATDFGVSSLHPAVHGMKSYIKDLFAAEFSERDIKIMAKENPAKLLNLT